LHTKDCPRTGKSISARRALISGTREGQREVLRLEEIMLPVKCIRRRLDPYINLPVHRRRHEQVIIMGKGAKGDDTLEAPK
jgi:hypothetical protein